MKPDLHFVACPASTISPRATWRFAYLLGWLVLGAILAASARNAHATAEILCVGSSFALGSALVTSDEGQSVDLDIRIRHGTYSITTTDTSFPSHVAIRGGYTDQDCTGGGSESQFNFQVQLPNVASDAAVAFTATDADDNTSELGECFPVAKAVLLDDIFKNGFENP